MDCNRCGAPNCSKQHECPARGKKCSKCGKSGHYAKCCRSMKKINLVAEEETNSADEHDWTSDRIHSIQPKIQSLTKSAKNGPPFYMTTVLVNNRPIKFIMDTSSPVTLIPKSKFNKVTTLTPITVDYRDVNDKKIKFERRTTAIVELDGTKDRPELLVTTRNTHPLLGLDWMRKLGITLEVEKSNAKINCINKTGNTEDRDITALKRKFHKLFNENHTVNTVKGDIQSKKGQTHNSKKLYRFRSTYKPGGNHHQER